MRSIEMPCDVCGTIHSPLRDNGITDVVVDIEDVADEFRISKETVERYCRICMMSLDSESAGSVIKLGCSCKNDLAAVHERCAQTWFMRKGDNVCEICHSIAQNVPIPRVHHFPDEDDTSSIDEVSVPIFEVNPSPTTEFLQPASSTNNAVLQPVFSRDEVSVPVHEADPSSSNAILVPVSSRYYTVAVPVSSTNAVGVVVCTSRSQYCLDFVCETVVGFLTVILIIAFLRWLFN